jgi:hypothetical protein
MYGICTKVYRSRYAVDPEPVWVEEGAIKKRIRSCNKLSAINTYNPDEIESDEVSHKYQGK